MSVLIKGMEMPKCCLECPLEDSPEFDSYCIAKDYEFIGKWEDLGAYKPDWCPLEEPKTGHWKDDICSNCGYGVMSWNNTPYCPNCGAKMRGKEE